MQILSNLALIIAAIFSLYSVYVDESRGTPRNSALQKKLGCGYIKLERVLKPRLLKMTTTAKNDN